MDILKIIFEHDMTLEHLSGHDDPRNLQPDRKQTLASFLTPQKTYCRYYFTGTRLHENRFGLSVLQSWPVVQNMLSAVIDEYTQKSTLSSLEWHRPDGTRHGSFREALEHLNPYDFLISGSDSDKHTRDKMLIDDLTGIRERFEPLTALLDRGHLVLLTEKAHHGSDLHLFSCDNLYESLFQGCQSIIGPDLRCFAINGKRVSSERHFYFETWTLDRPPHGFQEVTPDARIR